MRNSLPTGSRPTATVPVPAITAIPHDSDVPARSAMNASFTSLRGAPGVTSATSSVSRGSSDGPVESGQTEHRGRDRVARRFADRGAHRRRDRRPSAVRTGDLPVRRPGLACAEHLAVLVDDHRIRLAAAAIHAEHQGHAIASADA